MPGYIELGGGPGGSGGADQVYWRDIRDYVSGYGQPTVDIGPAMQSYLTNVIAGTDRGALFLPPTPGGFALWKTASYFPFAAAAAAGVGLEIFGTPLTVLQFAQTGALTTDLSGVADGGFALHINEAIGDPTTSAVGWGSGHTGADTSGAGKIYIHDLIIQNPTSLTDAVYPSFCVFNHIAGLTMERIWSFRMQYGFMAVAYCDSVSRVKCKNFLPHDSGFALGEGFGYRSVNNGDNLTVICEDGGNAAQDIYVTNNHGATITSAVGPGMRFQACNGVNIDAAHFDTDTNSGLSLAAHIECLSSDIRLGPGWAHRGKLQNPGKAGVPLVQINDAIVGNPSRVLTDGFTVSYNPQPVAGANTSVPDIYILNAVEGTRVVSRNTTGHAPKGGNSSCIGMMVRAATPTIDNVLITRAMQSRLASDFEFVVANNGGVVTAFGRKPGSVPRYLEALYPQTFSLSATAASDVQSSPGAITTGKVYVISCDNGYGYCTPYVAAQSFATASLNAQQAINLNVTQIDQPCIVRIWRAEVGADPIASPAHYVEMPIYGPSTLVDLGASMNGYLWAVYAAQGLVTSVADSTVNHAAWSGVEQNDIITVDFNAAVIPTSWAPAGARAWLSPPLALTSMGWTQTGNTMGGGTTWKTMPVLGA